MKKSNIGVFLLIISLCVSSLSFSSQAGKKQKEEPTTIVQINQWNHLSIAYALEQNGNLSSLQQSLENASYSLDCYDEVGNQYEAPIVWDYSQIDLSTPGLYCINGEVFPPEHTVFSDDLFSANPSILVSVQETGKPLTNCFYCNGNSFCFPWVTPSCALSEITVTLTNQEDCLSQTLTQNMGASWDSSKFVLDRSLLSNGCFYNLSISFGDSRTSEISFLYEEEIFIISFTEGHRDGTTDDVAIVPPVVQPAPVAPEENVTDPVKNDSENSEETASTEESPKPDTSKPDTSSSDTSETEKKPSPQQPDTGESETPDSDLKANTQNSQATSTLTLRLPEIQFIPKALQPNSSETEAPQQSTEKVSATGNTTSTPAAETKKETETTEKKETEPETAEAAMSETENSSASMIESFSEDTDIFSGQRLLYMLEDARDYVTFSKHDIQISIPKEQLSALSFKADDVIEITIRKLSDSELYFSFVQNEESIPQLPESTLTIPTSSDEPTGLYDQDMKLISEGIYMEETGTTRYSFQHTGYFVIKNLADSNKQITQAPLYTRLSILHSIYMILVVLILLSLPVYYYRWRKRR